MLIHGVPVQFVGRSNAELSRAVGVGWNDVLCISGAAIQLFTDQIQKIVEHG